MTWVSFYLVVLPIYENPDPKYLLVTAFICAGAVAYVPFVKFGWSVPGTDFMTRACERVFNLGPGGKELETQ